jgi:hypothetical protein
VLAVSLRRRAAGLVARATGFDHRIDALRAQMGGLESRMLRGREVADLREAEFSVFSQFGEDGIIQYLLQHVPIEHEVFVEFGVEDYSESNTRFLLVHDNWEGLILDGGSDHIAFLGRTGMDWRYTIQARSAFVDRDNINGLITSAGIAGDIGLLSVDIDGNDYWVLEAIDAVTPRILVAEYNSTFGPEAAVTIPYDPGFQRGAAHWSNLYWGASLAALDTLARRKGHVLVGGNSAGNNAFWVREELAGGLPRPSVEEAYRPSRFRESRDESGKLTYLRDHSARLGAIAHLPLWDVAAERQVSVGERLGG